MKTLTTLLLLLIINAFFGCKGNPPERRAIEEEQAYYPKVDIKTTRVKAKEALLYCQSKKFNTEFCILIDMSLHSGVKRFFIWNFEKDTIENAFLVSHGCCKKPWGYDFSKEKPTFSNKNGSHCSALGKYKIGQRAYSDWGIHIKYILHGLDETNNNALERFIVFHSWNSVSDEDVYPDGTPEGWGCPSISNNSMRLVDAKLQLAKKSVLMCIYQ